jgi:hypothetical protein
VYKELYRRIGVGYDPSGVYEEVRPISLHRLLLLVSVLSRTHIFLDLAGTSVSIGHWLIGLAELWLFSIWGLPFRLRVVLEDQSPIAAFCKIMIPSTVLLKFIFLCFIHYRDFRHVQSFGQNHCLSSLVYVQFYFLLDVHNHFPIFGSGFEVILLPDLSYL